MTQIEPDQSLEPDVATEWSASPDAVEWTFQLNSNATFHSEPKVTATDVIASRNHHRGEESTSAVKALLADVQEITDNGDGSITFPLGSPNDLPWLMTDYHLAICPANADGSLNRQSADGCGPYRLVDNEFGVSRRLVRHQDWHGEGAFFDEVQILYVNDPNARWTAVITGDVDAAVLFAEHAKAAGITVNVVREPNDGYYSDVWLKKPFCMVQWGARPTPDVMYSLAYKDDAAWNESSWQNARFNELLFQGKVEPNDVVRDEIYTEMGQILRDEGGTLLPYFPNFVYARRTNVKYSGQLAASWPADGARSAALVVRELEPAPQTQDTGGMKRSCRRVRQFGCQISVITLCDEQAQDCASRFSNHAVRSGQVSKRGMRL